MTVYRIARKAYINNLSGAGARLNGGRWNKKGTSVLYTSANRSLATIEYLAHLPMAVVPKDIRIAGIIVPDDAPMATIDIKSLPDNWRVYPAPLQLAEIGDNWINENKTLLLKVPSALVKGEWNILINPYHQTFEKIGLCEIDEYNFDSRLLR